MRMLRSLAMGLLGPSLFFLSLDAARAEPAGGLSVEGVADVDTQRVRSLIEGASERAEARAPEPTPLLLTLEDAIRVALEANLRLQIATIDRDVADALVPAARAKFHPVPGFDVAAGSERLVDGPDDITSPGELVPGTFEENAQSAIPFVRQELPTGGTVTVSAQLLRDSTNDRRNIPADELSTNGDRYLSDTAIVLTQPLLRGGRVYVARREILDSEYNLSIAESQLRAQILQVTAQVKEAYYNAILARRLI